MSIVYVVQNTHQLDLATGILTPRFDLSSAEQFGELIFLLPPSAKPFNSERVISTLKTNLTDFSNNDYLLLIGNPCLVGFAVAIAADANNGSVKLLQWNMTENHYLVVEAKDIFFT